MGINNTHTADRLEIQATEVTGRSLLKEKKKVLPGRFLLDFPRVRRNTGSPIKGLIDRKNCNGEETGN
jgi:hypothetical protein